MHKSGVTHIPKVLSAGTIKGDRVINEKGEDLGKIEEIMIDVASGRVAYTVLSFGGFLGLGDKLFAVPWPALRLIPEKHAFMMHADKELLERAPGFDKDHWPGTEDTNYITSVYEYYGEKPYWSDM